MLPERFRNRGVQSTRAWLLWLVIAIASDSATQAVTAADADSNSGTDASQESDSNDAAPPSAAGSTSSQPQTGSQRREAGDKGGVFLPSENISEDKVLTFPVDI